MEHVHQVDSILLLQLVEPVQMLMHYHVHQQLLQLHVTLVIIYHNHQLVLFVELIL